MSENLSMGKLLPNITITFDQSADSESCIVKEPIEKEDIWNIEAARPAMINLPNSRSHDKDSGFTTGLDLIAQEQSNILDKRAERFGIEVKEGSKETMSSLYKSMGILIGAEHSAKMKHIRLNALHMRGVEDLSGTEILNYFKNYLPSKVEWINDNSCNVVFSDETTCARALLGLSKPLSADTISKQHSGCPKVSDDPDMSSLSLNTMEVETMDTSDCETKDPDNEPKLPSSGFDPNLILDVPVPPGVWRRGVPHPWAKVILFRFATTADKKLPGSERRSLYYQKYGNPNFGGLKGLISSSRKKQTQNIAVKKAVHQSSAVEKPSSRISSQDSNSKRKPLRMRMYADEEEELRRKKLRSRDAFSKQKSVHSRLGLKFTKDELCHLGSYRDDDRDVRVDSRVNFGSISKPRNLHDLRSKLRNKNLHEEHDSRKYAENRGGYFKRKHRSPLCADEEDNDEEDEDESSSGE